VNVDQGVGAQMMVRLLGPVEVRVNDGIQPVRGLRRAAVVAALALHPGEVLGIDRLVDIVWGDAAPASAATTLHTHVWHLRRMLDPRDVIVARSPGYLLDVADGATDVQAAQRLIQKGNDTGDLRERVQLLTEAAALWRGQPLATVTRVPWFDMHARRLEDELLQTRQALIGARLGLGEHLDVLSELEVLCRQHPMHEQFHAQLMVALYRANRQADALAVYRRLRHTLGDDLGLDPSQPLRDLEAGILRQDPSLIPSSPISVGAARPTHPTPAQLPPTLGRFVGRTRELGQLDALLRSGVHGSEPPPSLPIAIVSGSPGVGKSTLAVHWAHQVAHRFPDGQLYVNLRGFDPQGSVVDPADALGGFLDALSVPVERIPAGLDAQVGLYRSLMADKRLLVVLDNARDADQVRPLLPAGPGCVVLITSRSPLTPLVVIEDADLITLDLMTVSEAGEMLAHRVGPCRARAEPDAVREIVEHCARLPLALGIAAARAAAHPHFPLAETAGQLRRATSTLDILRGGDRTSDLRVVFSCSYRTLSPAAAELFRLLGLHPGPDIGLPAAASLVGRAQLEVQPLLDELAHAQLISEYRPGRYSFHDLLRAYAIEQSDLQDSGYAIEAAKHRLLDHYLFSSFANASFMGNEWTQLELGAPVSGVSVDTCADSEAALAWLDRERAVIVGAIKRAADDGLVDHAWQLAWSITTYLLRRGHWHDISTAHSAALTACRRNGNIVAQAHALYGLASGYARSGRFDEAFPHFIDARDLFEQTGEFVNRARIYSCLAWLAERRGDPADGLQLSLRELDLYRAAGNRTGEAEAFGDIGWCYALLGEYDNAIASCRRALAMQQELGHPESETATWDSLGFIYQQTGDHEQAIICYERAIDLCRELSDRYNEAGALNGLGDTYDKAGDPAAAERSWREALTILESIDHPDADDVRAKLHPAEQQSHGR
jgi:DNA-binding SARP family transcriptional activator/tetratricopeptide (TPR) repeat protein